MVEVERPDALVWDQGVKKRREVEVRVNVDLASLPGPPGFLNGPWMQVPRGDITGADIAAWQRLLVRTLVLIALFHFLPHLCLKELKFGTGASLSEVCFGLLVSWVGSFPAYMFFFALCVDFWGGGGGPKGTAAELLDGTLKLRYCTTAFSRRCPPWTISGLYGRGGGQGDFSPISSCGDRSGHVAVRVQLTKKSRPS